MSTWIFSSCVSLLVHWIYWVSNSVSIEDTVTKSVDQRSPVWRGEKQKRESADLSAWLG